MPEVIFHWELGCSRAYLITITFEVSTKGYLWRSPQNTQQTVLMYFFNTAIIHRHNILSKSCLKFIHFLEICNKDANIIIPKIPPVSQSVKIFSQSYIVKYYNATLFHSYEYSITSHVYDTWTLISGNICLIFLSIFQFLTYGSPISCDKKVLLLPFIPSRT